jgi:hypothetical protein
MRALVFAIVFATACGAKGGGDATFKVFYPDPPADGFKAKVGKKFFMKPVAQCVYSNGRDARWSMTGARLATGKLPPGLTLEEGKISGTPVEAGSFSFAIEFTGVSCAGDKRGSQTVEVTIVAK